MFLLRIVLFAFALSKTVFCLHSNFLSNTKGAKVFRVILENEEQLRFLKEQYKADVCDFWSLPIVFGVPVDMMVTEWMVPVFTNMLKKQEIPFKIHIEDVQAYVNQSQIINEEAILKANGKMNWQAYHSYERISEYLEELPSNYPFVTVTNIGKTYEKRTIQMIKISSTNDDASKKTSIWIDGGMQGREWISPAVVTYLINELTTNYDSYSKLLSNIDVYLVPLANPDGYAYSMNNVRLWSKNRYDAGLKTGCIGINLNRNWDFHWNEIEKSDNPCAGNYPGPSAFSEFETKALSKEMMKLSPNLKVYLSLASFGQYWNLPYSYNPEPCHDSSELVSLAHSATREIFSVNKTKYRTGSFLNRLLSISGTSHDWAKGVNGVKYSYKLDLPDEGEEGFFLKPHRIENVGKEIIRTFKFILQRLQNNFAAKDEL